MLLIASDHSLHIFLPLLQTQQVLQVLIYFSLHLLVQGAIVDALTYYLVAGLQLRLYKFGKVIVFL